MTALMMTAIEFSLRRSEVGKSCADIAVQTGGMVSVFELKDWEAGVKGLNERQMDAVAEALVHFEDCHVPKRVKEKMFWLD